VDANYREFLKLLKQIEAGNDKLLAALANDLERIILKDPNNSKAITKAIDRFIEAYMAYAVASATKVGDVAATGTAKMLIPKLTKAGATREAAKMAKFFKEYPEYVAKRFPIQPSMSDKKTFIQRVKRARTNYRNNIFSMVEQAVNDGTDPRKLAYQIRDYVLHDETMSERAYKYTRMKREKPSSYKYKGAPGGSVQYNAMRIVRTEMARTYRTATLDAFDGKPYSKGWNWVLSNRHGDADICNDWADASPYKKREDIPDGHPHDLCRVVAQVMSDDELVALMRKGVIK
jgi:hypothetical protein